MAQKPKQKSKPTFSERIIEALTLAERITEARNLHQKAKGNIPALLEGLLYELSRVRCILEDALDVSEED